ncbi:DGPFAETKE family protein [Lepidopterella palustris CBS 459.81]|uniref:DGPFAETKE family protein n=1 Tax=Lepidopterella palustris CBS 459.81 TaxID=1314670 RepID=A0A8E2DYD1_9PEZI|nr:DGPFAETKE family protein [Lepidopterella palustris CBS 459.81]
MPRFIVLIKSSAEAESGALPPAELMNAVGEYNEKLAQSGKLIWADGFLPTSTDAARIVGTDSGARTVTNGPFGEPIMGGYFILNVSNLDEAIQIVKDMPVSKEGAVEIRRLVEIADIPAPPDQIERAKALRALMNKNVAALG